MSELTSGLLEIRCTETTVVGTPDALHLLTMEASSWASSLPPKKGMPPPESATLKQTRCPTRASAAALGCGEEDAGLAGCEAYLGCELGPSWAVSREWMRI